MCAGMLLSGLSPELTKVQFFLSSIFRVQTPLSLLIMNTSHWCLRPGGISAHGQGFLTALLLLNPDLICGKNACKFPLWRFLACSFFPLCYKILKILVSVSSVAVPFPGLHSVILHVFPWCPCHASLMAQLLGL